MITQDRRPRDWAYGAEFQHDDLPTLLKMAKIIRTTEDTRLLEDYYAKCEKRLNDHKSVLTVDNKNIEFIQVVKSDDLATNPGIDQYIRIALNTSSARWTHIGYGFGGTTANPNVADVQLNAEYSARISCLSTLGWARVAGVKMMFGGIIGESISATPTNEMGVFNASSGGIMLNHNNFNQIPLSRTTGRSVFILSSVYQTVPKA
jgi:hypothetical protein